MQMDPRGLNDITFCVKYSKLHLSHLHSDLLFFFKKKRLHCIISKLQDSLDSTGIDTFERK